MVAYSFRQRFVPNIQAGLRVPPSGPTKPKRQTIRANRGPRNRHAVPGEIISLYFGMRTKNCQLIGTAECCDVSPITLTFGAKGSSDFVECPAIGILNRRDHLDQFAQMDGFIDWMELRSFWSSNYPGVERFEGVMIRWKPVSAARDVSRETAAVV